MATTPRAGTVRILTLTNWYPPHHFGGYELSCYDVMRRLEQRGHEVTVLCSAQRRGGVNDDDADAQHERHVHRDLELWIEDDVLVRPSFSRRLQIERHNQAVLRKVLERGTFDVVSVWHMGAMSVGLLTTIAERQLPVVYAVCDDWLIYVLSQDRWAGLFTGARWRRAAGRALHPLVRVPTVPPDLSQTGAFCFVSEFTRGCAQAMSQWSFPISTVVFSGIERAEFAPIPAPERRWRDRLLYVGRFDRRKGLETLIRAVALLPPTTQLDVCGLGGEEERDRLIRLAADLGVRDRVHFGSARREELAARYRDADVFVFPSEWAEPFGLVPIEAMACGTPVLATGLGGSAEFLVEGTNCLLFQAGEPRAIVDAVMRLREDPALRRRLVVGGLRTAEELDVDKLADTFEQWHIAAQERFAWRPADRTLETPGERDLATDPG